MLLQCAAFGAVTAVISVAMSPLTSSVALASPIAYSVIGSVSSLVPLAAARWIRAPGSLLLTALIASLLALPFIGRMLSVLLLAVVAVRIERALSRAGTRRRYRGRGDS